MTEQEWLTSDDVEAMLKYLRTRGTVSDRKLRLWVEACREGQTATLGHEPFYPDLTAAYLPVAVEHWCEEARVFTPPKPLRAALLREVFGNPFRPGPLLYIHCPCCRGNGRVFLPVRPHEHVFIPRTEKCTLCKGDKKWRAPLPTPWLTPAAVLAAQAVHDERRWGDLPVIADMLEEAGCTDADILGHLRGKERCPKCRGHGSYHSTVTGERRVDHPCGDCDGTGWIDLRGPHVLGCWALGLLLGHA